MGARPEQCACCPQCPDVDPLVCALDTPPATNEHPAVYNLNTNDGWDWNVEQFSTAGVGLGYDLTFPQVFIDQDGQRFDPLTAGAARLDMTATPGSGQRRWIAGLLFWPSDSVTPPDILSRYDGPVTQIGCLGGRRRWLRGTQDPGSGDNETYLFGGVAVRHRGEIYIQPQRGSVGGLCWQNFAPVAPPAIGVSYLSRQFRRPLQARDTSDDAIIRLPPFSEETEGGHGGVGKRVRDVLFRLDKDSDPLLVIDDRPEDWLEKYDEYGFWIGLSDIRLDQKDGTAPPVNLGKGVGNDRKMTFACALDNLCLTVTKSGLYPTRERPGNVPTSPIVTRYGRGANVLVDDPLDTLPVFGAGPDEWFTQRYQQNVSPQSTASASVDAGYLTWTEQTPGFQGFRPIVLATPYTIPAGLWATETWRLCIEWTYREIDHKHRNYPAGTSPPIGGTYLRQTCGVGVPGLFGVEVMRDQWLAARRLGIQVRTVGPTPYWLETGYAPTPPANWDPPYPGIDGFTGNGNYFSGRYYSNGFVHADDATPYDGSRIAVVACKSKHTTGKNRDYKIDIHVFVEGVEVTFPSLYSFATGNTHTNGNGVAVENNLTWQFTDQRVYLIGEFGGAWQDLKITHTP